MTYEYQRTYILKQFVWFYAAKFTYTEINVRVWSFLISHLNWLHSRKPIFSKCLYICKKWFDTHWSSIETFWLILIRNHIEILLWWMILSEITLIFEYQICNQTENRWLRNDLEFSPTILAVVVIFKFSSLHNQQTITIPIYISPYHMRLFKRQYMWYSFSNRRFL